MQVLPGCCNTQPVYGHCDEIPVVYVHSCLLPSCAVQPQWRTAQWLCRHAAAAGACTLCAAPRRVAAVWYASASMALV